ncbi:MAG: phosphoglycerate mutase [Luteimonas sp.]
MASATLLLPPVALFGQQRLGDIAARAMGRADRLDKGEDGRRAQLLRHFILTPRHWPIAALTRQAEASDAGGSAWLRADPVHISPDINGARLLAYGEALSMTDADRAALLPALQPLFGDAGFALDAPTPSHWYLRLARETKFSGFTDPAEALGEDVFDHFVEGAEGRRWRALLSETQVILHNHAWNTQRARQGKAPINSLWFWGGGTLPQEVNALGHESVFSDDESVFALGNMACIAQPLPTRLPDVSDDAMFDLRHERDLARLQSDWLLPALAEVDRGRLKRLELDLADGLILEIRRNQRWRFWRTSLKRFGE